MMIIPPPSLSIWSQESETRWPTDKAGHVFIARAVRQIGRAIYGEQWQDRDTRTGNVVLGIEPFAPLPDMPQQASEFWLLYANDLLKSMGHARPDLQYVEEPLFSPPPISISPGLLGHRSSGLLGTGRQTDLGRPTDPKFSILTTQKLMPPKFSNDEWVIAKARRLDQLEELKASCERFKAAKAEITRALEVGELVSAVRHEGGGAFTQLPAHAWDCEPRIWEARFRTCRMARDEANWFNGDGAYCIFITEASLQGYLTKGCAPMPVVQPNAPNKWWPDTATPLQASYNKAITAVLQDEPLKAVGEIENRVWDYLKGNTNLSCAASHEAHRKQVRSARKRYAARTNATAR